MMVGGKPLQRMPRVPREDLDNDAKTIDIGHNSGKCHQSTLSTT